MSALENEADSQPAASSTHIILDRVSLLSSEEEVDVEVAAEGTVDGDIPIDDLPIVFETPPQARSSRFKPPKRARSPLPVVDTSGPPITPGNGGFTGLGKYKFISLLFIEIKRIENLHFITRSLSLYLVEHIGGKSIRITWRKRPLIKHVNEVAFRGNSHLPEAIKELQTPLQIFNYFFNDTLIDIIVAETNRAASRGGESADQGVALNVTSDEIRHFIGILVFMSVYKYPNMY